MLKTKPFLAAIFAVALPSLLSFAGAPEASEFQNNDCARTQTCDLVSFRLVKTVGASASGRATHIRATYLTRTVDDLEHYGIVQFIHGCVYETAKGERWDVVRDPTPSRPGVLFHHNQWSVDVSLNSPAVDPMYWSAEAPAGKPRQYHYLWSDPASGEDVKYGTRKPAVPELSTVDDPTGGSIASLYDIVSSLDFKTCLYRIEDIPRAVDPTNPALPEPIHCFDWSSHYAYDHAAKRWESPRELDPFCLGPPVSPL